MKAPIAAPMIVIISNGNACSTTPMLPPWAMNTPKMQPSATTQPMMTNMVSAARPPAGADASPQGAANEVSVGVSCLFLTRARFDYQRRQQVYRPWRALP